MNKIIFYLFFFWALCVNAQSSWKKMTSKNTTSKKKLFKRTSTPKNYTIYNLDVDSFVNQLASSKIIMLPISGEDYKFTVKESSNFSQNISPKYSIKSYSIYGIDDPTASGKITIGLDGIHVIIFSTKQPTYYIDTYTKDNQEYIAYSKSELEENDSNFECHVNEFSKKNNTNNTKNITQTFARTENNNSLRTYRLALACTGEYAQYHINNSNLSNTASDTDKKAVVLSAMNTTMSRVNGIFERDLGVKMEIVLNNNGENELIFLDGDTDNLSNNNVNSLITESQNICDNVIGSNNYDIGHTFSQANLNSGLAILSSLCDNNGYKGQGVTIRRNPTGDSFDVDFVSHEIGHQFGANHTFNYLCGDNQRSNKTAVEVGSGSTIMAYAGVCSDYNIQDNTDDYFHSISIFQMLDHIESTSCATSFNTTNTSPIANAGKNVVVPKSTPLVLKGEATDNDGDILTYCWEQIDTEIILMPLISTNLAGPTFRSFPPSNSSNRYLPSLETVVAGSTANEWEVIPSVARTMEFSLLVRDNNANGGAISRDDLTITVADIDPFLVTSQNSTTTWKAGSNQTITWDQSTTNQAPINCSNVSIKLSTDGGKTFPIILVESTPNDGDYTFVVPSQQTSEARIMVEAIDNLFYNINSTNISITNTESTFTFTNLSQGKEFCMNQTSSIEYIVDIDYINNFNETINLSVENLPDGVTATLSSTLVNNSDEVTITLHDFSNTSIDNYTISLKGISDSNIETTLELPTLSIRNNVFESINVLFPENNSNISSIEDFNFQWNDNSDINTDYYDFQLAEDENFENIIIYDKDLASSSYSLSTPLNPGTYYWKVKPKNNCSEGEYSSVFNFSIVNTEYCSSNFTAIIDNNEYISNVNIQSIDNDTDKEENGYGDYTNISTNLILDVAYPLNISLEPLGFPYHVFAFVDWNKDYYFDPSTERYDLGEHNGETATASTNITVPNDAHIGDVRMRIVMEYFDNTLPYGTGACEEDHNDGEYGETEDYTLNISEQPFSNMDDVFDNFSLFPNPVDTDLFLFFTIPYINELTTINVFNSSGRLVKSDSYKNSSSNFSEKIEVQNLSPGLYLLYIENGNQNTTKKIIVK